MKPLRELPHSLLTSIRSILNPERFKEPGQDSNKKGKGHNLLRLHEYQHRVIVEIFRVSMAGFLAFSMVLVIFSLYTFLDPFVPTWLSYLIACLGLVLLFGLFRTVQEFLTYRQNYEEVTALLRAKLVQQTARGAGQSQTSKGIEHRLLSALKPKEHTGWDHKVCRHCNRSIELLAKVCQHCGNEQNALMVN